ncbi:MAG: metallopeptidase TldD-related protein [Phycisphaerae bacterium]
MTTLLAWISMLPLAGDAELSAKDTGILHDSDTMMRALAGEMQRSMDELLIEGLARPYHIRLTAEERLTYSCQAAYGALIRSDRGHTRQAQSRVRVGNFELDNSHIGFPYGGRTNLPLEDDESAIRHALWRMLDQDYKRAVEVLTRKVAYLQQKNVVERPEDYAPREGDVAIEPTPEFSWNQKAWEYRLRQLSQQFAKFPRIQDSQVTLFGAAMNQWIVDSEDTRLRIGDTGTILTFRAEIQADEGMMLQDSVSYVASLPADFPEEEELMDDITSLCNGLAELAESSILDEYTGPVLFDAEAAGRVVESLLADKLCARPIPLGRRNAVDNSLARKIGRRILPRTFTVYDDPRVESFDDKLLLGSYRYDDEGVPPQKVELVERGILNTMLSGREPTKKIKQTNGHARQAGFSDPQANIGCLFVQDTDGLSDEDLVKKLREAAEDEGLTFGIRVKSMKRGGGGSLGDPIFAYKVYVDDGREELIRGVKFGPVDTRELKRMLAAGNRQAVYNSLGGVSTSIIAPGMLFEELELRRIEAEFDRQPILAAPAIRTASQGALETDG